MKHFTSLTRAWQVAGLLLALWLAAPAAHAQTPTWTQLSAATHASGAFSYVLASAPDAAGNVYVAGQFSGTVTFGTTVLTSNATSSSAFPDGFVAKWNGSTGTFAWALALGGAAADQASAIAASNGAVYVAGFYSSATAAFGPLSLTNANPNGSSDMFVAKLTDAGSSASFIWVRSIGDTGTEMANGLALSGSSLYLAGTYTSATLNAGGTVLTNAAAGATIGSTDMFVAKLTDAGTTSSFAWAQSFGGSGPDEARALALNGSSLYVLGSFASPTIGLGATVLTNAGGGNATDMAIAKLTDAGSTASVVWAVRAGGTGTDTGDALALSGTNLYVTGSFSSSTATLGAFTLTNAGGTGGTSDVFVAKLADAGPSASFAWAQVAGGIGNDRPRAVAVRGANVCVAGSYGYPTATFGTTALTNRGTGVLTDIFVAKLTDGGTSGAFAWAQSAGSTGGETVYGLSLIGNSVVTAGGVSVPATFGTLTLPAGGSTALAFVATLSDPTLTATTSPDLSGTAFSLYPNPARAATTVQLPALPGTTTATLTLRDALGRALHTATVALPPAGLRHEFDLSGLPAGIYALQVQAGTTIATRKLVLE